MQARDVINKSISIVTYERSLIFFNSHSENRVLRIFGPKRDEETGGWRKLHNEELHKLYSSPSIIRIIKSRRMRWAGHVARMENRNAYRILVESQKEGDH
jgi:hypothetical protein